MSVDAQLVRKLVECLDEVAKEFHVEGDSGFWCEADALSRLFHLLRSDSTMISQSYGQRQVAVPLIHMQVPARVLPPGKRTKWYDLVLFNSENACRVGDEDMRYLDYSRQIANKRGALAVVEATMCGDTVQPGKISKISNDIEKMRLNILAGQIDYGFVAVFCWTFSAPGSSQKPRTSRRVSKFDDDIKKLSMLLDRTCPGEELRDRVFILYASDSGNDPPLTWLPTRPSPC